MIDARQVTTTRRRFCTGLAGVAGVTLIPSMAFGALPEPVDTAIREVFGAQSAGTLQDGRVTITLPPIAENGFSVPVTVDVESPMTAEDHIRRIVVLAERNPIATLIQCHLGPRAGRARMATRVRLAGTQTVRAVAERNDGTLWLGSTEVVVTLAACIVL